MTVLRKVCEGVQGVAGGLGFSVKTIIFGGKKKKKKEEEEEEEESCRLYSLSPVYKYAASSIHQC